ncbi:uncharacterized protein LOC142978795 [Anticarsia gemmatalis]|uniref:uncharacterized protein LOC142978795 n=1 Tax=Anticarsia gemmatalis TaxID=129554 RepID=UPI003F759299
MQFDKSTQLVKAVENFPCLYNFNLFDYLKKDVTDEAWSEVANQTQLTVSECKEKWKNLRYGLLRSLRPNPDGTVKKKYYLHEEMEFVLPFIKTSRHETPIQLMDEVVLDMNIGNEQDSEYSSGHPHYQELENSEPPKKKSRPNDICTQKLQQNSTGHDDFYDDARKMFLLSLLPEINAFTEFQMRVFRRKVFNLIDEIGDGPAHYDMCLLEWQKDSVSQDSERSLQNDIIKKEPL